MQERDRHVAELQGEIRAKDEQIASKAALISRKDEEIAAQRKVSITYHSLAILLPSSGAETRLKN